MIELTPEYIEELRHRVEAAIARNEETARVRRAESEQKRAREILGRRRAARLARLRDELLTPQASELRKLRLRRGLTLRDLAARVGVSHTTLWRADNERMRSRSRVPNETWQAIADVLGCDVDRVRPSLRR